MKKYTTSVLNFIREEYKFLIFLVVLYCILQIPVNYYIIVGGGISDISSRVEVSEKYSSKGSFNISYVMELAKSNVTGYLLSYVIPSWEREEITKYKITETDSIKDLEIRSELDLQTSNGTATYWAYTLANKPVELISTDIYIYSQLTNYDNDLKVGDKIIEIDNHSYETVKEYTDYFQEKKAGDKVTIKIERNGHEKEIEAVLSEDDGKIVLGVYLQLVKKYQTDPKVNIKFKRTESGPSAGLITTLEIYNQLTKKDITKGLKIAGTGTIEGDGTIGQIGGIEHKLLGADRAKADIFLSPGGNNYETAIKYKKEKKLKIKIIKVDSIEDAIKILDDLK